MEDPGLEPLLESSVTDINVSPAIQLTRKCHYFFRVGFCRKVFHSRNQLRIYRVVDRTFSTSSFWAGRIDSWNSVLDRRRILDAPTANGLIPLIPALTPRDCVKILGIPWESSIISQTRLQLTLALSDRVIELANKEARNLEFLTAALARIDSSQTRDLLSELVRKCAPKTIDSLTARESVNVLNISSRIKAVSEVNSRLLKLNIRHLRDGELDHRGVSLLAASLCRLQTHSSILPFLKICDQWSVTEQGDWSCQSVALFVYSVSKLCNKRTFGYRGIRSMIERLVPHLCADDCTSQNISNLLVGLVNLSGFECLIHPFLPRIKSLPKKDLIFLLKARDDQIGCLAIDVLLSLSPASFSDLVVYADVGSHNPSVVKRIVDQIKIISKTPVRLSLSDSERFLYILSKCNHRPSELEWDKLTFESISSGKSSQILFALFKLDLPAPRSILDCLADSAIQGSPRDRALAFLAIACMPGGARAVDFTRLNELQEQSGDWTDIDRAQVAKGLRVIEYLQEQSPTGGEHEELRTVRSAPENQSRMHSEVQKALVGIVGREAVCKELHVPEISSFIDLAVVR